VEYGNYVARTKTGLLATENSVTGRPTVTTSAWPVMVQDGAGRAVRDARFLVKYLHLEEKGSDVNVAAHLLTDALDGRIDGAVVISNDSDLALPIRQVRERIPLGLVNPSGGRGIRTHVTVARQAVFKTAALGHYASPPPCPAGCKRPGPHSRDDGATNGGERSSRRIRPTPRVSPTEPIRGVCTGPDRYPARGGDGTGDRAAYIRYLGSRAGLLTGRGPLA
jgi:hypothetical protein